jgi:TPP-dependent pyruvate/acetoin dehydrogenase alpha subunit
MAAVLPLAPIAAAPTQRIDAWELFRRMRTVRSLEEKLLVLYAQGKMFGTVHTCIGQEASAVGVVSALDPARDFLWSNHRGHGHYIAFTDDVDGLIAEVMGRATGMNAGIGGSQHLHASRVFTNGILGGIAPCAVGCAFGQQLQGTGALVTVFLGDGSFGEGQVYESLNMAALWSLPVLFVLEDNGYAQSTPTALEHAGRLHDRALPFGIPTTHVVADDVLAVQGAAAAAVAHIRAGHGPAFLAVETFRFSSHSKGDDTRSPEEIAAIRERDALRAIASQLGAADPARLAAIEADVAARISDAVARADAAPLLAIDAFMDRMSTW